ncbi:hypothetical protein BT69DRAFT_1348342 [Atractiella rhizophila]|nr:hypothetical protein BT69DRAFT_1348342 [Atractiella rhizophila]
MTMFSSLKRSLSRPASVHSTNSDAPSLPPPIPLPAIPKLSSPDPTTILSLRLAYLSLVLAGPDGSINPKLTANGSVNPLDFGLEEKRAGKAVGDADEAEGVSVARRTGEIEKQLKEVVDGLRDHSVRRFIDSYNLNAQLLKPPLAVETPNDKEISYESKALILSDMSNEIIALERNLREIETFEQRGTVGGRSLGESEELKPEVEELQKQTFPELSKGYGTLEERTSQLLADYNHYVDTLSELFVEWNRTLEDVEETLKRWEKEDGV